MFGKDGAEKIAAPVVEKAAEAASGAPSYFFDSLVRENYTRS